jgi:uncharacterized protein (UPF0276 family)
MAQEQPDNPIAPSRATLGTTYEGRDSQLLETVLPLVDYVEVTPDSLAEFTQGRPALPSDAIRELKDIGSDARIVAHGVGLSIGTFAGYSESYLALLDQLMEQVQIAWHSEHLGYVNVDGQHLGTMLALPKTEQMLDLICERVWRIQRRYPIPFLLENIVHMLPDYPGDYSDAGFLNALTERTGCGLILDVYNLECDSHNHRFDIEQFLAELDMSRVREIHIAGGVIQGRFRLDVHSRTTQDSTIELARRVKAAAPRLDVITYELLPEAVPKLGYARIAAELARLRKALLN